MNKLNYTGRLINRLKKTTNGSQCPTMGKVHTIV